jgi:hypothetical protein
MISETERERENSISLVPSIDASWQLYWKLQACLSAIFMSELLQSYWAEIWRLFRKIHGSCSCVCCVSLHYLQCAGFQCIYIDCVEVCFLWNITEAQTKSIFMLGFFRTYFRTANNPPIQLRSIVFLVLFTFNLFSNHWLSEHWSSIRAKCTETETHLIKSFTNACLDTPISEAFPESSTLHPSRRN